MGNLMGCCVLVLSALRVSWRGSVLRSVCVGNWWGVSKEKACCGGQALGGWAVNLLVVLTDCSAGGCWCYACSSINFISLLNTGLV